MKKYIQIKKYIAIVFPLVLTGCEVELKPNDNDPVQVRVNSDFSQSVSNWRHGFSDYPVADKEIYQLQAGLKSIPNSDGKRGYMLSGSNRSDDLFMYLKRPVTNLVANTRYQVSMDVTFWSDTGNGCFGIGGSPGNSVFIKAGATEQEPKQADYYMNISIGSQSQKGANSEVLGDIAVNGLGCDGTKFGAKQLSLISQAKFEVISSEQGSVWLYVGSDSGYEGVTHLYYQSINATLTPL